jgi:hypothetical protein
LIGFKFRIKTLLFSLLLICAFMPRGRKSKVGEDKTESRTKDTPRNGESDMIGAATKTTRAAKRPADGHLAGAATKKLRPIVPTSVAAALAKIKDWKESRGYSEGHSVQIISAPATWTTEICADPNKTGCVENLVRLQPVVA